MQSPPHPPLLNKVKLKSVLHRHSDRRRENGALCAKKDNVICGQEERERLCLEGIVGLGLWDGEMHTLERIGCLRKEETVSVWRGETVFACKGETVCLKRTDCCLLIRDCV